MKKYWVTPIQQTSWNYVLIYDEQNDIFYATPRDMAGTLDEKMCKILIVLCVLGMISTYLLDPFIRSRLWNNYIYAILVMITILLSCVVSKYYFQKLAASMEFSRYQDKKWTLARGMFTLEQRQKYFTRVEPKKRSLTLIGMAVFFLAGDVYLSVSLMNIYSTIMLLMVLLATHWAVFSLYYSMYFLKDSDTQYLAKKFASKR